MSAERLDEIKARADAATPGPWEQCGDSGTPWNDIVVGPHPSGNESWCDTVADCDTSEENAAFIAAAREDVPWLVEQVARLTAERDAQIKRAERLERWYADALTMLDKSRRWKSVASLTAERDSLAARLAEAVHLTDVWVSDLATDAMVNVMDGAVLEAINEQMKRLLDLRDALTGSEADTSDTQPTDPGCGCSTNPARARYADGDPAGCYCTCSDDAREGCEHEPDEPQPTGLEVK